jgi:hypothetical protein
MTPLQITARALVRQTHKLIEIANRPDAINPADADPVIERCARLTCQGLRQAGDRATFRAAIQEAAKIGTPRSPA